MRVQLPNRGPCSVITEQLGLGIISWVDLNHRRSSHDPFSADRMQTENTFLHVQERYRPSLGLQGETISTHRVDNHTLSLPKLPSLGLESSQQWPIYPIWRTVMIRWHGTGALMSKKRRHDLSLATSASPRKTNAPDAASRQVWRGSKASRRMARFLWPFCC